MDFRTVVFYVALLAIAVTLAELYVLANGIGQRVEKANGGVVSKKPKLGRPILFLIACIIVAVMTIPK